MTKLEMRRRRAIRKGVQTRAVNRAMLKRWREVEQPASQRMDELLNYMLSGIHITLYWNPLGNARQRLKKGVEYGELVKILNGGRLLRVLPEGYKRPQDFHPGFWELVI